MTTTQTFSPGGIMLIDPVDLLAQAFPDVDPGFDPCGSRVLVQIRTPKLKLDWGLILGDESKETELWNCQVGKVIKVGPLAYHSRDTMVPYPEGAWCQPGDFVRVPKYVGDRWIIDAPNGEKALFAHFNDLDILGRVTGDPLAIRAFL
jgi:co-chaperonin GroES (HSP10)